MWRFVLASGLAIGMLMLSNRLAFGGDSYPYMTAAAVNNPYAAALDQPGLNTPAPLSGQPAAAYNPTALPAAPPPGGWSMANEVGVPGSQSPSAGVGRQKPAALPSDRIVVATPLPSPPVDDRPIESTWYFRLDSFHWNERLGGRDFVNEDGPLSTVGYMRRSGQERFRFELFGGTVAYDGATQSGEPFRDSCGTNYLGLRAEYDLLVEPTSWSYARLVFGVGTRFWFRDLHDTVLPDTYVVGYQETWWTFYPYVGLEIKPSDQPGLHVIGSVRFGVTPLTYQAVNMVDDYTGVDSPILYPRCGVTGQAELGVAYRRFTLSAFTEVMTWGESAMVRDSLQPASRMLTIGSRLAYTF